MTYCGVKMISFSKMQGLGNDFVVIDNTKNPVNFNPEQIKKMSDRRYGIGFDQLLLIEKNSDGSADFNYRIFNADGSESYQCGNGARCVARFILERELSNKKFITLKTAQVFMKLSVQDKDQVQVFLDPPKFNPSEIPFVSDQPGPLYSIPYEDQALQFYVVNVGNPHAVIFEADPSYINEAGSFLGKHPSFPEGVNVGFAKVISSHEIQLDVYERGVGRTLACGSGACAAAVAGIRQGLLEGPVRVKQAGGDLQISWPDQQAIEMMGPAEFVFEGKYHI